MDSSKRDITPKRILKPSQVLRLVRSKRLGDPQPRGHMRIVCQAKGHSVVGETESPTFWENGTYVYCEKCKKRVLARIVAPDFEIDLTGERKKYALFLDNEP